MNPLWALPPDKREMHFRSHFTPKIQHGREKKKRQKNVDDSGCTNLELGRGGTDCLYRFSRVVSLVTKPLGVNPTIKMRQPCLFSFGESHHRNKFNFIGSEPLNRCLKRSLTHSHYSRHLSHISLCFCRFRLSPPKRGRSVCDGFSS